MWGVSNALGKNLNLLFSGRGSFSKTSNPAPAISFVDKAIIRSSSLIIGPLEVLIKKEVFEDIGLMDEKYFVYFDDTDFLYRVLKDKRHKLLYNPSATLYHKVGSLSKSFMKTRKHKIYRSDFFLTQNIKNHIYFLRKIGGYFAFVFCLILFFKNNIRFLLSPRIKLNLSTFILINKAYLAGWRL